MHYALRAVGAFYYLDEGSDQVVGSDACVSIHFCLFGKELWGGLSVCVSEKEERAMAAASAPRDAEGRKWLGGSQGVLMSPTRAFAYPVESH